MSAVLMNMPIAVDVDTAAAMLGGIGRSTFLERVSRGDLPKPRKIGAKPVWLVEELADAARAAHEPKPPQMQRAATALYRHFDGGGRLLYVGISLKPLARLASHNRRSAWATSISSITLEWFPDRPAALAAELKAIREEAPAHNIAGVLP